MRDVGQSHRARRQRVLVTPEGIAVNLTVATRGARFGALALDLMIIGCLQVATTLFLVYLATGVFELDRKALEKGAVGSALQLLAILWFAAMFLFRNAYFMAFELGARGATWGKRAVGIRIASRDGGRLTSEMVLARNLLRDIELFLPVSIMLAASSGEMGLAGLAAAGWFLVFALFPLFNRDSLRAGDLIAGTWVVEAPRQRLETVLSTTGAAQHGTSRETGAQYRFGERELAIYGEYELQTLERVLRENRHEAVVAVHEAICRKIGWDPGSGDEYAFLEAYYAQLRARLEGGMRMGKRKADKFQ